MSRPFPLTRVLVGLILFAAKSFAALPWWAMVPVGGGALFVILK